MMKLAYMLDLFPVFSETFIVREILELRRNGFNVIVFARRNTIGGVFSEVIHADAKKLMKDVCYFSSLRKKRAKVQLAVYHLYFLLLNPIRYLKTFWYSFTSSRRTFKMFQASVLCAMKLKRDGVSHIHAHFALDACKLAMLSSMLTGIPYSFTVHAHDIFIPEKSDLMEDKISRAKFVVCISEYNKNYILKQYHAVDPRTIRIIHCGVDVRSLSPGTKKRYKKLTILAIGRLFEQKGLQYLVQAGKILREQRGFNFVCKIIGEGEQRPELEEIISSSGLTDVVHLLGAMEQADVMKALTSADVFVLPCVTEKTGLRDGIPVSLMEAMALEIPVVSTKVSGIPELVKDGAGILVEPRDVEALAIAIESIFMLRDEERVEMGRRARAVVEEEFNLTREVQKLAELIRT